MAEISDSSHLVPVRILEVKSGGEFLSTPIIGEYQEDAYSVFLADLNNYMNELSSKQSFLPYQNFKKGELVAVHCKAQKDDDERLWYRGRILSKFKNVSGITVKVLLVDCSSEVYVPGTLMRKLEKRYQDFPIQMMNCCLYGLKPLAFIATTESLVSRQVVKKWDSSAKVRLQELIQGASSRIVIREMDENGTFHVTLHLVKVDRNGRHNSININELFVEENYAVFEKPAELIGEVEDDAASTMSESSLQDSDEIQKALSPDEFKKLMERKKLEQDRFNLGHDSRKDEYRDIFGPPGHESGSVEMQRDCTSDAKKSKSSGVEMVPANCKDGVDLADDQSCISCESLLTSGNVRTEKLINMLKDIDAQKPAVEDSSLCSDKLSKDDRNVSNYHVKSRRTPKSLQDTPPVAENKTIPQRGPFRNENIWSIVKKQENEIQSSSTSESEIESSDRIPTDNTTYPVRSDHLQASAYREVATGDEAGNRTIDTAVLRYEKECLKQQHKNRGDENSFQAGSVTWQLLKVLGVGDAVKPRSQSSSTNDTEKIPVAYGDVLVSGDRNPKSVLDVETLSVPNEMKLNIRNDLTNTLITKPTPLQSYTWPAVLRGRHVVGIDSTGSGKKLGYLLPILKQVVDSPLLYKNLPKGHGPIVLILTTDWNEARKICKTCEVLLYSYRNRFRSRILYGGHGDIQKEMVSLINGCEILVSTIPPLLSMIEKHCTSLERLCHLVFDRAHNLVENFAEEIKTLMRLYAESLTKTIALNLPHQMIAMSSEWSRGLESLLNAYFDNPLIIIPNKLEASVFKKVEQRLEICALDDRMDHVMSILRGDDFANHNMVIFVNSANEADRLGDLLESQCIGVLKATEFMSPIELKDIETSWNHEVKKKKHHDFVLVMTDRVASRIPIRNATYIISYEFPMNKTDFGRRLSCLLGAMKDKTEKSNDIISMVFLTEESENAAPAFARLLRRARQRFPSKLNSVALRINRQKEESAKNCEICDDFKYYGTCRDAEKCTQRHTVFADSDEPKQIPKSGVVKVKILDVVSANVYWGKIIDHKLPNGANKSDAYDTKGYFKLAYDMQVFYAIKSNRRRHGLTPSGVLKDDICVIKSEDGFQRVRVESIERRDTQTAIATEVYVFGLDNGISQKVSVNDLFVLPTDKSFSLEIVPQQAIELIVCGVKPVDKSFSWTVQACVKMDKSITGKILEGKIALGLRNTLWLDPLVMKEKCDELNANITTLHVGAYLLECGFAEKNRSHVKNLRGLCKDCLPSVISAVEVASVEPAAEKTPSSAVTRSMETVEMPESDFQDVYVSAVENPGLFFVQLWKNVEMLDKLEDKIEAVMKVLPKHEEPDISGIGRGTLCLAQFTLDDKWYRARVLEISEELDYRVFYVDHGETEWIHEKRLWKAWPEVLQLPCQAIECSLVHISPQGMGWTSEDGDCLWNLCDTKLLVAQVKSKTGSDYSGAYRYSIELYDTTGTSTINMSHELVFLGRALGSQDCIQEIFPDSLWCPENREVTNAVDCLPDLCLQTYRCEVAAEQMELVRKLHNIVDNASGEESTIIAGTKSITKLVALCHSTEVTSILIDTITRLMQKNESLSSEILREGGLRTICNLLNQESNVSNWVKVVAALSYFTKDPRNKQALSEYVCIESLCKVLKESRCNETTRFCLEVMCTICKGNDWNIQCRSTEGAGQTAVLLDPVHTNRKRIFEYGGLSAIVQLASSSPDTKVLELCSIVLCDLAQNSRIRENLCETGVIDVAGAIVSRTTNKVCLLNCLTTMKIAVSSSQLHREYIRQLGVVPAIERVLHRPMAEGIDVKRLCRQLLANLKISNGLTGSGQQEIHVPKIEPGDEPPPLLSLDELPCVSPTTLWSQHEGDITLAIQLRGVQNEEVEIGERIVSFRCFTDEFKYQLELELFDAIIPESSSWQVHGGEVLILLTKLQKFHWPRLLFSKIKPPFLYIDFNRWSLDFEDEVLTQPTKLPPRSTNIKDVNALSNGVPDMYYSDIDSSDDEESSSDLCDELGPIT